MAESADAARADLEKQIADLRKEVSRMSKSLAARASDVLDDAGEAYEGTKDRVKRAARQVGEQAQGAADLAREHPGTVGAALTTAGLIGLAAGLLIGSQYAGSGRGR